MSEPPINTRYRQRPIEIDAYQMTQARRGEPFNFPSWLCALWNKPFGSSNSIAAQNYKASDGTDMLVIHTAADGVHLVRWDDWIVMDAAGQIRPMRPNTFAELYETVTEEIGNG